MLIKHFVEVKGGIRMFNQKLGIIFINGENLIDCEDDCYNALDRLHQLSSLEQYDIVRLWDELIAVEKHFFDEETIQNGVKKVLDEFYIKATGRSDIHPVDIEDIYYINGCPASLADIVQKLDNIEDRKIKELYHSIVNKEELYTEFCNQCNALFNRFSNEKAKLNYKKKCNLEKLVALIKRYLPNVDDYVIGILAPGDAFMRDVYIDLFAGEEKEGQKEHKVVQKGNIIIVPNDEHRYEMNNENLYLSIKNSFRNISNFSAFCLIDTNKNNIEAAKKAGWDGVLMELQNKKTFCSLIVAITIFIENQKAKKANNFMNFEESEEIMEQNSSSFKK